MAARVRLAILLAGLTLVALGSSLTITLGMPEQQDRDVNANAFASLFQVRRWNPPTYKGDMGVQTLQVYDGGGSYCTAGFPVYTVVHRIIYVPTPLASEDGGYEIKLTRLYVTYVNYYLLMPRHCVEGLQAMYQPDTSGYKISDVVSYLFPVNVENNTYKSVDAALVLVEVRSATSTTGFPPPPPPTVYDAKILRAVFSQDCSVYYPFNETLYSYANYSLLKSIYNRTWFVNFPPNPYYYLNKSGMATGYTRSVMVYGWHFRNYTYYKYYIGDKYYYGIILYQKFYDNICGDTYFAQPGDSGAPVFVRIYDPDGGHIYGIGMVIGGNNDTVFVEPLELIIRDYKNLTGQTLYVYGG